MYSVTTILPIGSPLVVNSGLRAREPELLTSGCSSTVFNHMVDRLSATFAALGDPTRRAILERLAAGEATVNELAEPFPIMVQAVSSTCTRSSGPG